MGIVGQRLRKIHILRNVAGVEQPDRGRIRPLSAAFSSVSALPATRAVGKENVRLGCLAMACPRRGCRSPTMSLSWRWGRRSTDRWNILSGMGARLDLPSLWPRAEDSAHRRSPVDR